jgi:hypothetical protein
MNKSWTWMRGTMVHHDAPVMTRLRWACLGLDAPQLPIVGLYSSYRPVYVPSVRVPSHVPTQGTEIYTGSFNLPLLSSWLSLTDSVPLAFHAL